MSVKVITIGKKHESWVLDGIKRYQERLKPPFDMEWVVLPNSPRSDTAARQDESQRILSRLDQSDFVVLLDERGKNIDSPGLSKLLGDAMTSAKKVVLIIGGAYGVDETLTARANFVWSLSKLVFPHQLVRLITAEQIYRAQEIYHNHPYHHS